MGRWDVRAQHEVTGGSGVRLAVRTAGPAEAPAMVLLHGWAQSAGAWSRQFDGPLAERFRLVAVDLRGHGDSAAPADGYDLAANWAADVRALLEFAGRPAVLVGWSYGGLVIADYLRVHGTEGVAGIALVGAITEIGRGHPGGRVGPAMRAALPAALDADPALARPALQSFATGMSATPLPAPVHAALLAAALAVPPAVRAALFARNVASADVLAAVDVPALVLHGRQDAVVDPAAAEYAAGLIPRAESRWFAGVGHLPFLERPAAFDAALAAHADRCFGAPAVPTGTGRTKGAR